MSGSKTAYLEQALLDLIFNGVAFTPATTLYIAASTAAFDPNATGSAMNEVTGGGYTRIAIPANTTDWAAAAGSNPASTSNNNPINFPQATADWGTVLSLYAVDASAAGNTYYGADLAAQTTVGAGSTLSVPAGGAVFQEF